MPAETQGEKTKPAETITKPAAPRATDPSGKTSAEKPAVQIVFAGLCHDEQGRAIAGAQVLLYLDDGGALSDERLQSVRTDQAGQFRFQPVTVLPGRSYLISAAAQGRATVSLDRFALPRRNANHLQIVMPEAASVLGKITGPDGRPVAGAKVWTGLTHGRIDGINTAISDAEGLYEISDLEKRDGKAIPVPGHPGAFYRPTPWLFVQHPQFAGVIVELPEVPSTVNVTLQPAAVVEGRVVYGDSGKPAAGVRLSAAPGFEKEVFVQRVKPSPIPRGGIASIRWLAANTKFTCPLRRTATRWSHWSRLRQPPARRKQPRTCGWSTAG